MLKQLSKLNAQCCQRRQHMLRTSLRTLLSVTLTAASSRSRRPVKHFCRTAHCMCLCKRKWKNCPVTDQFLRRKPCKVLNEAYSLTTKVHRTSTLSRDTSLQATTMSSIIILRTWSTCVEVMYLQSNLETHWHSHGTWLCTTKQA